jgi:hypothetical protein
MARSRRAARAAPASAPPAPTGPRFRSAIIEGHQLEVVVNGWFDDGYEDVNWEWLPYELAEGWQTPPPRLLHVFAWRE